VTISAVQENLPALRHTLLSNADSENPFPVPASVTAALEPASRETIGQSTPFLKVLAAAVALLEAEAAPLSSYAGSFATLCSSLDTFFTELPLAARERVQRSLCARFAAFFRPDGGPRFLIGRILGSRPRACVGLVVDSPRGGGGADAVGPIRLAGNFDHLRVILAIRKSTILTVFTQKTLFQPAARSALPLCLLLQKNPTSPPAPRHTSMASPSRQLSNAFFFLE